MLSESLISFDHLINYSRYAWSEACIFNTCFLRPPPRTTTAENHRRREPLPPRTSAAENLRRREPPPPRTSAAENLRRREQWLPPTLPPLLLRDTAPNLSLHPCSSETLLHHPPSWLSQGMTSSPSRRYIYSSEIPNCNSYLAFSAQWLGVR